MAENKGLYHSPRGRYQNDPAYNSLVNAIWNQIETCQFTPSEVREAAVLACILYEEGRPQRLMFLKNESVEGALKIIEGYLDGEAQ